MPYLATAFLILLLLIPSAPAAAQTPAEVYSLGMRNPYRWSFDRLTGDIYVGDVGGINEEIDYVPAAAGRGANLGWNCFSGTAVQSGCTPAGNYIPPTYEYPSSSDVVIGGYIVRDPSLPSFAGQYLFGRFASGNIMKLGPKAAPPVVDTGLDVANVAGFGEDGVGHLYAISRAGQVYRLGESGGNLTKTSIGGTFDQPLSLSAPPGVTNELFIAEQAGRLMRWTPSGTTVFVDLTSVVRDTGGEEGLLSVAVAPDYATSGRIFVYYVDNGGDLQIDELRGTVRSPVLTIQHDQAANHNGGQLLFGPDNALYLTTGDGGTPGDPEGDAQNPSSLLGKILRIDVGIAPPSAGGPPPAGSTPLSLRARAPRRQRVLRNRGAIVYVRCNQDCQLSAGGTLLIGKRKLLLRRVHGSVLANRRARVKLLLRARGRRALRAALRRGGHPRVKLRVRASAGGETQTLRRAVRVRR